MLTPSEKSDLLLKLRQGTLSKGEAKVALLKLRGTFEPAMSAHGQPETDERKRERLRVHPEQFVRDPEMLGANLAREVTGIGGTIQALFKKFAPSIAPPGSNEDFVARQQAAREDLLRPRGGQFGGITARPEGTGPSSVEAARTPVSESQARGIPDRSGTIEGTPEGGGFLKFLLGTAPVEAGRAIASTPGGALSDPALALQRARGTLGQQFQDAPLQTLAEAGTLGLLTGEVGSGIAKLIKAGGGAIAKSAGRSLGEDFLRSQAKTADLESLGKAAKAFDNLGTPQFRFPELPPPENMRLKVGNRIRKGQMGEGFVTAPGKLTKPSVKITETEAGKLRTIKPGPSGIPEGAVEFRPAISNVAPSAEAEAFVGDKISETAAPLTAQVVVPETGPAVFRSNLASNFFRRVNSKATSGPAKTLVGAMDNAFTDHHLLAGKWIEKLRDVGLHRFDSGTREAILTELGGKNTGNSLAKGAAIQFRKTLDETADIIEKLGIMVEDVDGNMRAWSRRTDYAPRMVRPEILDALYKDVTSVLKSARKKVGDGTSDDILHSTINSLHEEGKLKISDRTERAINHLIATNRAKNAGEAVSFLARRSYRDKYRFFGNIDASRTAHLPAEFYETDAARVLPEYLYGAARRIAEAKHLGPRGEKLELWLKQMGKNNPKEAEYFTQVSDVFLGHKDRAFLQSNPGLKKLYDAYTNYAVATKIGLGTATIPNITQFAISTLPVLGVQRTAKAALRVAFDPVYRASLRDRGVVLSEAMRKIMQQEFGGTAGEFTSKLLVPFESVNKAQKYVAAAAMEDAYDDLAKMALNATDAKHAEALRVFQKLGIAPAELGTARGKDKAIFKFAALSQLQKNVLNEPLLLNMPSMQPFTLFKRFGIGQANFINDWVFREVKHGNVMPVLRLMAAGYAGGEFVVGAKERLRGFLSGQRQWNPETTWWKKVIRAYSEVGSLGVFADLWRVKGEMPEDIWTDIVNNVKFAVSPPPLSDLARVGELATSVGADVAERGVVPTVGRSASKIGYTAAGSLFGAASERLKTATQIEDEIKNRRRRTVDDIKSLMVTGKAERGVKLLNEWNKKFPDFYIEVPTPEELKNAALNRVAKQSEIPVELLK